MARAMGRYELLRRLGRGGMAEVFLARRRAGGLEKELVVKRIRPERAGDLEFLALFVREARLSMALAHQNIVPVFDFGRAGDQVYLAMERVEGQDLGSSIARAGTACMPTVAAAFVAAECCQALDYAHRRARDGEHLGIVHRDVTPRNVLLSWSGEVKLTDFGIATLAGDETRKLIGTPAYMAPEQARREAIDVGADLYGLGMVLREALTGVRARPGADRETQLANARSGALASWPADRAIDDSLVAIVDRATAPARGDRYPDIRAMYAELDRYILAARARDPGESPSQQIARWLATTWSDARDDADAGELSGDELVSLFDDGEAFGTGTERSMLATAGDEPSSPPPMPTIPARLRRPVLVRAATGLVVLAFLVLGGGVAWRLVGGAAPGAAPASAPADAFVPAMALARAMPPDASPDARTDAALLIDAAVARIAVRPRHVPIPSPLDAAPPAGSLVRRDVLIGAKPWAVVTIDDDPTAHETPLHVELTVGAHRLHFTNAELHAERTIELDVPATSPAIRVVPDLR